MKRLIAVIVAAAPAGQVFAADADYTRALAAGYEAGFTCSATFNAGQTREEINANELTRVYDELRVGVSELDAVIDREAKTVSVAYRDDMPPRIAVWRPYLGCTQLPIGSPVEAAAALPALGGDGPDNRVSDKARWPMGDAGATRLSNKPALISVVAAAFDGTTYDADTKTSAVLVMKGGRIIAERYAHGVDMHTPQRTWSVAKSIAGTLLGVAAAQGKIDLDAPAPVPEWQAAGDPRGAITTDQLMRMASGLTSDFAGNRTDAIYLGGTSVQDSSPGQALLHTPGTVYRYANNDTLLAMYGLRQAVADDAAYLAFPYRELFWKIGMTRTYAETDWRGDFVLSSQVWTTARDLARLGQLYLNNGVWGGERLLPEGFAARVSAMSGPQPSREWGYGATFWVATEEAGLPDGTFAAFGNRGQYLVIVPEKDLVIVRRGYDPIGDGGRFDVTAFARDVIAAVD